MRCPDCNKFVSFDTDTEPEIEANVEQDGSVGVQARIVNTCAECSTELKEANFSNDDDSLVEEVAEHKKTCAAMKLDVKDAEASRTDRRQTHDRRGKPIRNPRYQKQYYGYEATVAVVCETCGHEFPDVKVEDESAASGMDELV